MWVVIGCAKLSMERSRWVRSLRTGKEGLWLVACRERDLQCVLSSEYSSISFSTLDGSSELVIYLLIGSNELSFTKQ